MLHVTCYMLRFSDSIDRCLFLISVDSCFVFFLMWLTVVLLKKLTVVLLKKLIVILILLTFFWQC